VLVVIGGAPGPLGVVIGALVVVLLTPFVMATTFLVGLSDTWLDIRARRAASPTPGS
jgi:ABC-type branched-subunit amino acid transport system permease subunit